MGRVNVFEYGNDGRRLAGHFNTETATTFEEETYGGEISANTLSGNEHETLYRTPEDRWVLSWSSRVEGVPDRVEFINHERARKWLLLNHKDEAVTEHFGPIADEEGPEIVI